MGAVKISEGVYWVGVQDPDLKVFDIIMETEFGTSYNAYLIKGSDQVALIETVKAHFLPEYIANLQELVKLQDINYLILNHTEPDHAGSVEQLLQMIPGLTVVAHPTALEFLSEITNSTFNSIPVGNRAELSLGDKQLQFITAQLLHWPDTIYTYVKEDKLLFSCDSFGSHFADIRLFNDLIDRDLTPAYQAYFDDIMGPFKPEVQRALRKLSHYEINMICPGHGPILRSNISHYLDLYQQWSTPPTKHNNRHKVVMAYVSAYGYTGMLADKIEQGLRSAGDFELHRFDLVETSVQEVMRELEYADGMLIGSPTINKDTLPPVWDLLTRLSPITHSQIIAGAFGAYGWSGEAVPNIEARFKMLRMHYLPGFRIRFKPSAAELEEAFQFGFNFAQALQGNHDLLKDYADFFFCNNPNNQPDLCLEDYPKKYANEDIIIYWNPQQCTHDSNCFMNLKEAFNPEARPWVNPSGAPAEKIIKTINRCPSGALKYSLPKGSSADPELAKGPGYIKAYTE